MWLTGEAMTIGLEVRTAVFDDLEAVVGWFRSLEELRAFAGKSMTWPASAASLMRFQETNSLTAKVVTLVPEVEPIGHFDLRETERTLHLGRLAVSPTWRRRGVGRFIVRHVKSLFIESMHEKLTLNVDLRNLPARNLYVSEGFVDVTTNDGISMMAYGSTRDSAGRLQRDL